MLSCVILSTLITYLNFSSILCVSVQSIMLLSGIFLIIFHPQFRFQIDKFLLIGAILALIGGIVLQFSFIPGLVLFLFAYSSYLIYFKLGSPWFSSKLFLLFNLAIGLSVLIIIVTKVDIVLSLAITFFVGVLVALASQAMSKAIYTKSKSYYLVAVGAWLIFVHDGLIGLNTFAFKIPHSHSIIVLFYGLGQYLIINNTKSS